MAGFANLGECVDAIESGRSTYYSFRKTPAVVTTSSVWFDMSMSPGNPAPQYYAAAPLLATQLTQSDGGLNHGGNVSPLSKFVHRFLAMSASATGLPMPVMLCDYLMYYPFCDTGTNDEQLMTNSVTLPRYTSGEGVQIMAVSVAPNSGLAQPTFTVNYTNSAGTAGRTSRTMTMNTATANGSILTSDTTDVTSIGPFVGLADGDKGVRSIESVTLPAVTEVGLFALVLVRPIMTFALLEQTAPTEVEPIRTLGGPVRVYDGAYLNMIALPAGSLSGVGIFGELTTVWN